MTGVHRSAASAAGRWAPAGDARCAAGSTAAGRRRRRGGEPNATWRSPGGGDIRGPCAVLEYLVVRGGRRPCSRPACWRAAAGATSRTRPPQAREAPDGGTCSAPGASCTCRLRLLRHGVQSSAVCGGMCGGRRRHVHHGARRLLHAAPARTASACRARCAGPTAARATSPRTAAPAPAAPTASAAPPSAAPTASPAPRSRRAAATSAPTVSAATTTCLPDGVTCNPNEPCCSGPCNPVGNVCGFFILRVPDGEPLLEPRRSAAPACARTAASAAASAPAPTTTAPRAPSSRRRVQHLHQQDPARPTPTAATRPSGTASCVGHVQPVICGQTCGMCQPDGNPCSDPRGVLLQRVHQRGVRHRRLPAPRGGVQLPRRQLLRPGLRQRGVRRRHVPGPTGRRATSPAPSGCGSDCFNGVCGGGMCAPDGRAVQFPIPAPSAAARTASTGICGGGMCQPIGTPCNFPGAICCNAACVNGVCGGGVCLPPGASCNFPGANCCGQSTCTNGTCGRDLPASRRALLRRRAEPAARARSARAAPASPAHVPAGRADVRLPFAKCCSGPLQQHGLLRAEHGRQGDGSPCMLSPPGDCCSAQCNGGVCGQRRCASPTGCQVQRHGALLQRQLQRQRLRPEHLHRQRAALLVDLGLLLRIVQRAGDLRPGVVFAQRRALRGVQRLLLRHLRRRHLPDGLQPQRDHVHERRGVLRRPVQRRRLRPPDVPLRRYRLRQLPRRQLLRPGRLLPGEPRLRQGAPVHHRLHEDGRGQPQTCAVRPVRRQPPGDPGGRLRRRDLRVRHRAL